VVAAVSTQADFAACADLTVLPHADAAACRGTPMRARDADWDAGVVMREVTVLFGPPPARDDLHGENIRSSAAACDGAHEDGLLFDHAVPRNATAARGAAIVCKSSMRADYRRNISDITASVSGVCA
jgi:hypothetical protein